MHQFVKFVGFDSTLRFHMANSLIAASRRHREVLRRIWSGM